MLVSVIPLGRYEMPSESVVGDEKPSASPSVSPRYLTLSTILNQRVNLGNTFSIYLPRQNLTKSQDTTNMSPDVPQYDVVGTVGTPEVSSNRLSNAACPIRIVHCEDELTLSRTSP
jgi:hypothetical protein